ncbi:MAG TPA: hypothetical protein VMD31_13780, partial [Opitutaceae bacterium]|nr:hypothetical protein [Opitutaceae bacterium]
MRALRLCLLSLLALPALGVASPPRFYVAGQTGWYHADAGSASDYRVYADQGIRSGAKAAVDWSVGADLTGWLSVEAGYVDFASFSSGTFAFAPGVEAARAEATWETYELRAYRL